MKALVRTLVLVGSGVVAGQAAAQQFHLYLRCAGQVEAAGRQRAAHLDLALRDNNMTALIQRSNVLPVGERLKYQASPKHYSLVARAPAPHSVIFRDWIRGEIFVWQPDLTRLHTVRLSIDRQTAALEGELLDGRSDLIGRLAMRCTPSDNDSAPAPRF